MVNTSSANFPCTSCHRTYIYTRHKSTKNNSNIQEKRKKLTGGLSPCDYSIAEAKSGEYQGHYSTSEPSGWREVKEGGLPCAVACGVALLGFVASCYGHGDVGLLPHHAVTLPLPSGEHVPSDGIVPSKNRCHLFKEHLSRMQSRACSCYAEAMVFFGRSPKNTISFCK